MYDNYVIINKRGLQWDLIWNLMKAYIIYGALSVGDWDQVAGKNQNQGLF